jgi:hypothetical protein
MFHFLSFSLPIFLFSNSSLSSKTNVNFDPFRSFTMDRFGRKKTIQTGALICTVGAILQSSARNLAMILVGRIIAGWAVGLLSMSVPVYQAECAHPKIRGLIVGLAQQVTSPTSALSSHYYIKRELINFSDDRHRFHRQLLARIWRETFPRQQQCPVEVRPLPVIPSSMPD